MTVITRRLPRTIQSRLIAITTPKNKKDSLPPADNILTAATTLRLDNIVPLYITAFDLVGERQATYSANTSVKNLSKGVCKMVVSHFIQVFNLGVARGVYDAAHRAYYKLPVDSDALPEMGTEEELLLWAQNLITGEGQRTAAGFAAMANPTIADVSAARVDFSGKYTTQSNLKDLLDQAQEDLEKLFPETDAVIKKVWDEAETFYNEEEPDSMRANTREWGVYYISIGVEESTINGKITAISLPPGGPDFPLENAKILVVESEDEALSDANGDYVLKTKFVGLTKITVTAPGYKDYETDLEIIEGQTIALNVQMKPLV